MNNIKRDYSEIKLARGIFFHQGHVLLVKKNTPNGHYFLPGGKVDPGESVITALIREFKEELGWSIRPSRFLGCYEHAWQHQKKSGPWLDIIEVNFLWTCKRLDGALTLEIPPSMEDKIVFQWVSLEQLGSLYLLPEELKEMLPLIHRELEQKKVQTFWGTSMKPQVPKH